jgi:hypothetical protein
MLATATRVSDVMRRLAILWLFVAAGCALDSSGTVDGGGGAGAGGAAGLGGGGSGGFPLMDGGRPFDAGCGFCSLCPPAPPSAGMSFLMPCCTETGGCGLSSNNFVFQGCLDLRDPGITDEDCPGAMAIIAGLELVGCCTRRGMCGISLATLGLGCVERGDVGSSAVIPLPGPIDIPCSNLPFDAGLVDARQDQDAGESPCDVNSQITCDPAAACVVSAGVARCACRPGYVDLSLPGETGASCRDINECLVSGACAEGECVNTPGGFRCDLPTP